MRTRLCGRCAKPFEQGRHSPDIFCGDCERATKDDDLFALIYEDRSGIYSLHTSREQALQAMKQDASDTGASRLLLREVRGQSGARSELHERRDEEWDHREQAWDRADFVEVQEMYR